MIEQILKNIYIDNCELTYKEMIKYFNISNKKSFNKDLDKLQKEKIILKDLNGKFVKSKDKNIYFGVYEASRKGFGFILMDEEKDIFIGRDYLKSAMDSDKVIVKLINEKCTERRKVGEIVYVVERNNKEIIGEFQNSNSFGFVIPKNYNINYDIYIPNKYKLRAKDGDIVVVNIYKWPNKNKNPEGRIVEILGKKDSNNINILTLMKKYKLSRDFPNKVQKDLEKIDFEIQENVVKKRRDLRNLSIVTIDGKDAKDLDDAVYVEKQGENYKLGVHIADVTHYVKYGTALDKEAFKRGTSIYLINNVIPMLPKELSNNLCSLNPNTDKLTLSCEMVIDKNGKVISYDIFESVINTKYRLTYDDVQNIIDYKIHNFKDIEDMIFHMKDLAEILKNKRIKRGAINLDFTECKILLNENNNVVDVLPFNRSFSHQIIEEFMLVCNETIAEHMFFLNYPFAYRIHEEPDMEKIFNLSEILNNLNYSLKIKDKIYSNQLQKVLDYFKGKDEEIFLSKFILRSMAKAKYSPNCVGHFGLSTKYYCHFTSPIRRYPDLIIHRILKLVIKGKLTEKLIPKIKEEVVLACENSSLKEREAEEIEREVYDIKKAEFMKDKIGEEYLGIISSVTSFGFFVELINTVRGLVHIKDLSDDIYYFDDKNMCLIGQNTKNIFKIGMKVNVKVDNVILDNSEIYFTLL